MTTLTMTTPAAPMLRSDRGNGVARYFVATGLRGTVAALVTLVILAAALVTLTGMAREGNRDACRDIMSGSDFAAGATYCRNTFGPRGY